MSQPASSSTSRPKPTTNPHPNPTSTTRPGARPRRTRPRGTSTASSSSSIGSKPKGTADDDHSDGDDHSDDQPSEDENDDVHSIASTSTSTNRSVGKESKQSKVKPKPKARGRRRGVGHDDDDEDEDEEGDEEKGTKHSNGIKKLVKDEDLAGEKEVTTFDAFNSGSTPALPSTSTSKPSNLAKPAPGPGPGSGPGLGKPTLVADPTKSQKLLDKLAHKKEKRRLKNKERKRKGKEGLAVSKGDDGKSGKGDEVQVEVEDDADKEDVVDRSVIGDEKQDQGITQDPSHSTSTATTTTTPKPPSNRQLYLSRLTSDPSFTPRVGSFWTHDERHYSKGKFGEDGEFAGLRGMSGWWRGGSAGERGGGRGGRGGMGARGMGRGGGRGGRGGFGVGPAGDRAGLGDGQGEQKVSTSTMEDPAALVSGEPKPVNQSAPAAGAAAPTAPRAPTTSSWGHDAYEKLERLDKKRTEQREKRRVQQALARSGAGTGAVGVVAGVGAGAGFAGRGRGRGRGGFGSGFYAGHMQQGGGPAGGFVPVNPVFGQVAEVGQGVDEVLSAPDGSITVKLPQAAAAESVPLASTLTSQTNGSIPEPLSTVDDRRVEDPVVVKLPLAHETVVATPSAAPVDHGEDSATVANLNLQAEIEYLKSQQATIAQKERLLDEELKRLEIGSRRVDSTAMPMSESGSMSSAPASSSYVPPNAIPAAYNMPQHHQPQPTFVPPGIGMADNGSFYEIATGQPVVFVASGSPAPMANYSNNPYPPQPYYPGQQPYFAPRYPNEQHQPHLSRGDSFGTFTPPPYGRDSPLGYPANAGPIPSGYFAPPRAAKVQIRAPSSHEAAILKNPGKLGGSGDEHSNEPHMIPEGQAYSMDNPYAYQGQQMMHQQQQQHMGGQGYYPGMHMHQGYPPQGAYDYGYGQY